MGEPEESEVLDDEEPFDEQSLPSSLCRSSTNSSLRSDKLNRQKSLGIVDDQPQFQASPPVSPKQIGLATRSLVEVESHRAVPPFLFRSRYPPPTSPLCGSRLYLYPF